MGAEVYFPVEAAMFLATALPLVLLARGSVRSFVFPAVMNPRRTLIVGAGEVGQVVERKIRSHPEYGLELVGFVDEGQAARRRHTDSWTAVASCPVLSTRSRSTG